MTWLIPSGFFMQQDTTQWLDCLHIKEWNWGRMRIATCIKKGGSITNLESREGQVEHGEVIIYCTSTHVMKDSSRCLQSCRVFIACTRETTQSFLPLQQVIFNTPQQASNGQNQQYSYKQYVKKLFCDKTKSTAYRIILLKGVLVGGVSSMLSSSS